MIEHRSEHAPRVEDLRREEMRTPDEVAAMVRLKALGWGAKRIAAELGCARNTVRRWLLNGGWRPMASPSRSKKSWTDWDRGSRRFRRHAGNADVVRQELAAEKGIAVSLRTVERAVAPLRRELRAEARATVRFETRPSQQLQIDFGERRVEIGGEVRRAALFGRRSIIRGASSYGRSRGAPGALVRGAGERVPALRRGAGGGPARQRPIALLLLRNVIANDQTRAI